MIIRIPDRFFTKAAEDAVARQPYRVGRRGFVGSALAAAALPGGRAWAGGNGGALPQQLPAIGLDGKPIAISRADIKEFRGSLRGQLLLAGNDGYDQARKIWNGVFDRHPALIARCADSADVVKAVNFARAHRVLTSVRGGGQRI